jgi:uncharacterized membrane protein YjgN (DUF898 family)
MVDGEINYSGFTLDQLGEALTRIDRARYPINFANLNSEIEARRRQAVPATGTVVTMPLNTHLVFTGTGAEYFRIWIVHTLLTLLTLGVYSAWAKVRKERWFAQHTLLLGDAFDYHGQPRRILLGRAIMLAFLIAYTAAVGWSPTAAVVVIGVLLVMGPALYGAAQRFRLANTSWRGLRFGFEASAPRVYAVGVPFVLVWTSSTLWEGMNGSPLALGAISLASGLAWPAVHAALKTVQHRSARYGEQGFVFQPATGAFYRLYITTGLVGVVGGAIGGLLGGMLAAGLAFSRGADYGPYATIVYRLAPIVLGYVAAGPFFMARLQQIVWSRTSCGPLRLGSTIRPGRLRMLMLGNVLLVVLTAGLYWPFAAVAIARYRVDSITVESHGPLPVISAQRRGSRNALGDAAADLFGLDLGW